MDTILAMQAKPPLKWHVDLATGVCTHRDHGLRVLVLAGDAQALNWPDVERALAVKHGHNTAAMGRRLVREALGIYRLHASHGGG